MRTLAIILIGLLVAALAIRLAKPGNRPKAAWAFTAVWLVATGLNLRTGLSLGHSLQEELPIHLLLFSVPVGMAWWLARGSRSQG